MEVSSGHGQKEVKTTWQLSGKAPVEHVGFDIPGNLCGFVNGRLLGLSRVKKSSLSCCLNCATILYKEKY